MSVSAGDVYPTLPTHIQRKIDDAFHDFAEVVPNGSTAAPVDSGGGFLVAEPEEEKRISLASIRGALGRLDLAEMAEDEDGEVMGVFRQASTGWDETETSATEESATLGLDDWRSVCAVLLEHYAEEYNDTESSEAGDGDVYMADPDEQQELDDDPGEDDNDDEYIDDRPRVRRARNTRSRARRKSDSSLSSLLDEEDTERTRQVALDAFALFFPDASLNELIHQKIMIKDIQRVAKLLGEKITAEEIVEMLEAFSTSPDKSMSLPDFERMMVAAKLV